MRVGSNSRPSRRALPRLAAATCVLVALAVVLASGARGERQRSGAPRAFSWPLDLPQTANGAPRQLLVVDLASDCSGSACPPDVVLALETAAGVLAARDTAAAFLLPTPGPNRDAAQFWLGAMAAPPFGVQLLNVSSAVGAQSNWVGVLRYLWKTSAGARGVLAFVRCASPTDDSCVLASGVCGAVARSANGTTAARSSPASIAVAPSSFAAADLPPCIVASSDAVAAGLGALGMQQSVDASRWTLADVLKAPLPPLSTRGAIVQDASKLGYLMDFAAFADGWLAVPPSVVDTSAGQRAVLGRLVPPALVVGWGDSELGLVGAASRAGAAVVAADWALNLPAHTSLLPLTPGPLAQRTHRTAGAATAQHTVTFLMSDGDNMQWLLNGMASDPRWFGSASRGQVPLGWTLGPGAAQLAPTVVDYLYTHATDAANATDFFVAAPSGAAYAYPADMDGAGLAAFAKLTAASADATDMHIVNVIDDTGHASGFSDQVAKMVALAGNIDAAFVYQYDNYAGAAGRIERAAGSDAALIGARYRLWQGIDTPASLAAKLNAQSRDPYAAAGYSLVAVHVWDMTVADVVACVAALDASGVRVVAPDVFVQLVRANVLGLPARRRA